MIVSFIKALWLRHAGDAARDAKNWPQAKSAYAGFLKVRPQRANIWVQYGHAAKESGDFDAAEPAYRRALELEPKNADTHLQLGHLLKRTGRLAEAEKAYGEALNCDPDFPTAQNELNAVKRKSRESVRPKGVPAHLRYVNIGTTGLCNASCFSCPTGKAETDHVPRVPMPMKLFEKLIYSIVDLDLVVSNQISFGLFGDSLVDPYVVERAKLVRALLPDAQLVVNTNGAAYNRKRHAALFEYVSYLALHVEAIDPDTYHTLMHPLRAERVFPKVEQIMQDFPGKVLVSCPVSTLNRDELPAIEKFFNTRGAVEVVLDPLSSRCAEDQEKFRSLAISPIPIRCPSEVLNDLIIDCDGQVLVCCQDFQRLEPIGNLAEESLAEVLTNIRRRAVRDMFDQGRHAEMKTCSRCFADPREVLRPSANTGYLYMADLARNQRDWQQARSGYWAVLQREPAKLDVWIQYGHAAKECGDLAEAESAYRHAISVYAQNSDWHLQLGHALKLQGRLAEAEDAYAEALACDPMNADASNERLALQIPRLFHTAEHARDMRDWQQAKSAYGECLRLQPARDDIWVQYGHAAKETGDLAEAEAAFRRAIACDSENADTYLQLGHLLKRAGRAGEAKQAYAAALRLDDIQPDARREFMALGADS